ncbi:ATP-dependent DNA helicase [Alkalihalobacillus sp. AL-G]|uniref:ATP-dependent DNA helicase n=1 Tax=Alkalihalobacillus sp. AL-G TaxID=2926399 RepID=UPI00272991C6|nr:ATP-dependent DNA helicase [Alkalihalobacillus sp. AL-G]WLD93852.1 ATP-dependent DNA helicase [Alkalihalobacillus sp. AL-G]
MVSEVKISVRPLVEYVYRSGSIDNRFRTSSSLTEGTKVHQNVQKTYGEEDQKEVLLKTEIESESLRFLIEGRCDGLLITDNGYKIDEIKSTKGKLDEINVDSHPVHWAQAKCYGYMYAKEHDLKKIDVQLTYVQVESGEQMKFQQSCSFDELEQFVLDIIEKFSPYARVLKENREKRDMSIKQLDFPFDAYRSGQRKFAGAVYKTIDDKVSLFANAPTGTGKTISTIFPTVKAIGEGLVQRFFYLTAKTITRTAAEDTLSLLKEQGLHLNSVTITAKDKICFKEKTICQKEYCEFADGYYDRVNAGILDILASETVMDRKTIEAYARKHRLCPFEFSLDVAYTADAVIGDYNYVFDPRVSLKRLLEEQKRKSVLLVDEAHNLVDRAREMFSAELFKSVFLQVQRAFKGENEGVFRAAKAINAQLLAVKKSGDEQDSWVLDEFPVELVELLAAFIEEAEKELLLQQESDAQELLLEAYFAAQGFVRIADLFDERFVAYVERERSEVRVRLFCLEPSYLLQQMGKGYRSKVYFSATLWPISYFKDMLGADLEEDYAFSIPSPFARENAEVFIQPLSTRYRDREHSVGAIVKTFSDLLEERPGNYLFFFPSYTYMRRVYDQFMDEDLDVEVLLQDVLMSEVEREEFLAEFVEGKSKSLIGFAVMGGIFSEGVDLKGDRLNGVVVVGVGLPQLSFERDIIKGYFTDAGKNGYDYAYVYPGVNKVLQAGGRLIRTEQDRGTIVLIDDRFLTGKYQKLLPEEWSHFRVIH